MLDLALVLTRSPLGLGALVAAAAAVAAALYLPRLALPIAAIAVALGGTAYISHVRRELDDARRERDKAATSTSTPSRPRGRKTTATCRTAQRSPARSG